MRDLTSRGWIVAKGVLFFALGLISAATLLLLADSKWKQAALLAVTVWACCRFYYFLFYVIERYVDPSFRFRGIWSSVLYFVRNRRGS
jgi:hypothetical protein